MKVLLTSRLCRAMLPQIMLRTFTLRLKPTRKQGERLVCLLTELCELYNAALQERRDAWKLCQKHIGLYEQMRELTQLRACTPESAAFPAAIQRDPLRRVDRAFDAFFRRVKTGQSPGYPRFRARNRYGSFSVDRQNFRFVENGTIRIVGLGHFRFKTRCRIRGAAKELRIKQCGNHWTATVACEIGPAPEKRAVSKPIGIDLGLTTLATLSDGTEIENPRWIRQEADRLAQANRELARKKRGSRNRLKARESLRRVHQCIAGKRNSYLHHVSAWLVANHDLIAYEDLQVANMAKSKLAKSVMDAAWGELTRQITYKAEEAGVWAVPVNPRGTTQTCSGCGVKVPKGLADRWHECACGTSLGRDHNAALNILALGESAVEVSQNSSL